MPPVEQDALIYGPIRVELLTHKVLAQGKFVRLAKMEYRLLCYLILHEGQVLSRQEILTNIWNLPPNVKTRTLVAHLEDPVRPDATNGNAVLHAARNEELYTLLFPRFGQGLDQWRLSLRLRFFCFGFFIRIPPWIAS